MSDKPICYLCKKEIHSIKELHIGGIITFMFAHIECYKKWYQQKYSKELTRSLLLYKTLPLVRINNSSALALELLCIPVIIAAAYMTYIRLGSMPSFIPTVLLLLVIGLIINYKNEKELNKTMNLSDE